MSHTLSGPLQWNCDSTATHLVDISVFSFLSRAYLAFVSVNARRILSWAARFCLIRETVLECLPSCSSNNSYTSYYNTLNSNRSTCCQNLSLTKRLSAILIFIGLITLVADFWWLTNSNHICWLYMDQTTLCMILLDSWYKYKGTSDILEDKSKNN